MATYNKRGYKSPKEKEEKTTPEFDTTEEVIDAKDSTTAEVFNSLDTGANKLEQWVLANSKMLTYIIGGIAVVVLGYFAYNKFVKTPAEEDAFADMYIAQNHFQQAVDATEKQDSLFKLALNGAEGKPGFVKLADLHSGTNAGKLANYYAGVSYLNLKDFKKALDYLNAFSTKDNVMKALAIGAKGDCSVELNKNEEALDFYLEAAKVEENDFVTPRFLGKAAQVAIALNKKEDALSYLKEIKEKYETSNEGYTVDALIASLEK